MEIGERIGRPDLLEAEWVTRSNSRFHMISETVRKETGAVDPERVYDEWLAWFKSSVK